MLERTGGRIRRACGARLARYYAAAILCVALALTGCGGRSPHAVAEQYLDDLWQFDYAGCYRLLSSQDRAARNLHEFLTEVPLAPDVSPIWFRPVLHDTHYELGKEHRDSGAETAFVPVLITAPDLAAWERTLDAAANSGASGGEDALRSLDTGDYPKRTWDDRIYLVKEHHHWHVLAGFSARDRMIDRHREALAEFHQGRFDDAIAAYHSMISELEQQPATGSLGLAARYRTELAELEKAKTETPAENAYAAKMRLSGVAMKMSERRVPGIFGAIANEGDRAVDDVRLAVTWYEGRGKDLKAVYREEHPVVLTPIEFTDFSERVIPFAPGETRRFGFILTAPAEIQQAASPYVTIASIAFTQIAAPLPKLREQTVREGAKPAVKARKAPTVSAKTAAPANSSLAIKADAKESSAPAADHR
jgi:tetratricopeptide (TPR) repeat protein